jgi:hypothetical protein
MIERAQALYPSAFTAPNRASQSPSVPRSSPSGGPLPREGTPFRTLPATGTGFKGAEASPSPVRFYGFTEA